MVKRIDKYLCEICNQEYAEKKDAIECESKGNVSPALKTGEIVQYVSDYDDYIMDSPIYQDAKILSVQIYNHYVVYEITDVDENGKVINAEWIDEVFESDLIKR